MKALEFMNNPMKPNRSTSHSGSLRAKLIMGNLLVTFLAIAGMGLYIYYRAQQSNNYLTTQLDKSVYQQAQDQLTSISGEQTLHLDNFFISIRKDITTIGKALGNIISEEQTLGFGNYWNASESLARLPNGSWDNPNTDIASIFIPAKVALTTNLVTRLNTAIHLDFIIPPLLAANPDVVAIYFGGESGETLYYPNIDLANIVPPDFNVTSRPWYVNASPTTNPEQKAVWSDPYLDAALNGLVITNSIPVYDTNGTFTGVAAMDIQLNRITDIIANIRAGKTGYAFLIDKDKRLIAMPETGYQDLGISPDSLPLGDYLDESAIATPLPPEFWDLVSNMAAGKNGFTTITINDIERFAIYQPVPEVNYSIIVIVPTQELLAEAIAANEQISQVTRNTIFVSIFLTGAILLAAMLLTIGIGNRLTQPLLALTKTAEEISGGNLSAEAYIGTQDEIGTLAKAFNSMTARLRDMIENLEKRVIERTQALERRAVQMQAALEVGRAAASMRNIEELLPRITQLISQRFGFYHVGIFLLDERKEYAVLRAANSKGGQAMLKRGHKLQVGQAGIVGYVTGTGEPRIALDVGEDKVYFQNPDLPETRSELALPLAIGSKVIGALDVQSTEEAAFSQEDLITLRVLADQISIAIDNARLFSEGQSAIEAIRRAYGDIRSTAWQKILAEKQKPLGYASLPTGNLVPVPEDAPPEALRAMQTGELILSGDQQTLYAPVVIGHPIGVITLKQRGSTRWTEADIKVINSLAEQLGTALESARLYEQIQDRAQTESMIADITSRIGSSIELETIMKTTVEEIGRIFSGSEILLQLKRGK